MVSRIITENVAPSELPRAPGLYDRDAVSNATAYRETMESLTEQSDEPSSNINGMIERLGIDQVTADGYGGPFEADFTSAPADFRESVERVERARQAFAKLPARVRSRFANDPGELLEFMERSDEDAIQEAIDLGLIAKRPTAGVAAAAAAGSGTPPATTPAGTVVPPSGGAPA